MNVVTRVSDKGQVVVPAATRNRLGWSAGTDLEVIESGDSVTLRRRRPGKTLTPQEAVARFKQLYAHQGPPVSIEEMDAAIAEEVERRATRLE